MGNSYSADVYKVISEDDIFILKISYDELKYKLEKNIMEELKNQNFPAPHKIGEIDFDSKKGIIMSYVNGLSAENVVLTKRIIQNLVQTINEFNNLTINRKEIPIYDFDIIFNKYNRNMELMFELLDTYSIVDKINTIVWCAKRNRIESAFFKETIDFLERSIEDGARFHEMLVIFKVTLLNDIKKENIEDQIEIKWFSKQQLDSIIIKPEFVKKIVLEDEEDLGWLVNDEIRK